MKTTLNKIRDHEPCTDGWEKLLTHLDKTKADDEEISLLTILDSNGFDDTLWCFRAVDDHDKEKRLFAVWCARQVQPSMKDKRSLDALDVAEKYANGLATDEELRAARTAALVAATTATARDAKDAWVVAEAARAASWVVAEDAWDAALVAADAARDAALVDTDAAEAARAAQEVRLREILTEIEK